MRLHYDYIIAGAGAAGMSLLMRMMNEPFFDQKSVLVIDKEEKNSNDHTWCFWEKEPDIFESIVHCKWNNLIFKTASQAVVSGIDPYSYKMIRSKDLYTLVKQKAGTRDNIQFLSREISAYKNVSEGAEVIMNNETFSCGKLFNSILLTGLKKAPGTHLLLQHFKGWFIETTESVFDKNNATFMDFSISQEHGTAFFYVLPTSENSALVEYTLFTEQLLNDDLYETALKEYVEKDLKLKRYTVMEKEFGIIPMTNIKFPSNEKNIIHMGTAGGWTKPSTGFTFKNIQRNTKAIVDALVSGEVYNLKRKAKRFEFYDAVFLNVLGKQRMHGKEIFSRLFKKNDMRSILKFLDDDSGLKEELMILKTLPTAPFLSAASNELF
jgi:lycopene beta-cyclase